MCGTFKDVSEYFTILVGGHLICSEDTSTSVDLSIQYIFIKYLLHSPSGRPPANSSSHQIQPENTLQISTHLHQPTLPRLHSVWLFSSSPARNANSMMDEACPDATHKAVSGYVINPILNSHHALSPPKS